MSTLNQVLLKSKFRGCFLGTLIGDCYGAPFAGDSFSSSSKIVLQRYFDKLDGPYFKAPVKQRTKDSVMTKCVAQTLVENPADLDPTKLAKCFVKEYFTDPRRGYSEGIVDIFHKLRASKFTEPFKPAMEQTGTTDNGAAIRLGPVALCYHDNYASMLKTARECTEITHVHRQSLNGALLQCITVHQGLMTDPSSKLDIVKFSTDLIEKLKDIEKDEEGLGIGHPTPYSNQIEIVRELLSNPTGTPDEEVVEQLGHSQMAVYSIPTAIYCFLRAQSEIENVETPNPFRRTLQYAISLGGDTATIAGMAGSIAGAFYGEELIGKSMAQHCEENDLFLQLADKLYNLKFVQ